MHNRNHVMKEKPTKVLSPKTNSHTTVIKIIPRSLPNALLDFRSYSSWGELQALLTSKPLLPNMLDEMKAACCNNQVDEIRRLYKSDSKLLLSPDPESKRHALNYAIKHDESLSLIIQLLEGYRSGLGLAILLKPDSMNQIPLETALRYGSSTIIILKIMAWMGEALNEFTLSVKLSALRQDNLNVLLFACILQGNLNWVKKSIEWGANIDSEFKIDTDLLNRIIIIGNPIIKTVINEMQIPSTTEKSISLTTVLKTLEEKGVKTFSSLNNTPPYKPQLTVVIDENPEPNELPKILLSETTPDSKQSRSSMVQSPVVQDSKNKQTITLCRAGFFKAREENMKQEDIYLDAIFGGDPSAITPAFIEAITQGKASLVDGFLKRNRELYKIMINAENIPGVKSTQLSSYQYSYLAGTFETSQIIFKYIGSERAKSEMKKLYSLAGTQAIEKIKELKDSIKIVESYKHVRCKLRGS